MTSASALVCVLLLLVAAASATSAAECELYTTCADCACSTVDYDLSDTCNSGCAWEVEAGACVSAASAQKSGVEAYYTLWKTEQPYPSVPLKRALLEHGDVTCDIGAAPGTTITIVCAFSLATAFTIFLIASYFHDKKQAGKYNDDAAAEWLLARVRDYVPPSDTLLWIDVASAAIKKVTQGPYIVLAIVIDILLLVPSIVWLGIGLPNAVEDDWTFGFYFPICFVGGFGALFVVLTVVSAACADRDVAAQRRAYALTDKHAILLKGNAHRREMGRHSTVKSCAADVITSVTLKRGKHVVFTATSGALAVDTTANNAQQLRAAGARAATPADTHSVTFSDLADPSEVFRLLQERSNGYDAERAVVGVKVPRGSGSSSGSRAEPPSGTRGASAVPRPVVSSNGFDGMEVPMLSASTRDNDAGWQA